jgi:hypothetical protein
MKTITNEWICGNVAVKATLDLPECVAEDSGHAKLMVEGLTQILQRKPSSAWEKEEGGYEKRPEGFKRNSIPFRKDSATKLVDFFIAALPKDVSVSFETSEHIPGDSDKKPSKEAEELWTQVQAYAGGSVRQGVRPARTRRRGLRRRARRESVSCVSRRSEAESCGRGESGAVGFERHSN